MKLVQRLCGPFGTSSVAAIEIAPYAESVFDIGSAEALI